jgi:hypothetical protein
MGLLDPPGLSPGGQSFVAKPSGDTRPGVLDWIHNSETGYGTHVRMFENTTAGQFAHATGLDKGAGGGFLASLKNAGGSGFTADMHGSSTGDGVRVTSGGAGYPARVDLHVGSKPVLIQQKFGQRVGDGVANGTTTFTSATAAFTAADIGRTITQTASRGEGFVLGATKTIVSVESATSVTLNAAATGSGTGINFIINERPSPTSQVMLQMLNGAGSIQFQILPDGFQTFIPIERLTSNGLRRSYDNGEGLRFYQNNGTNWNAHRIDSATVGRLDIKSYAASGRLAESAATVALSSGPAGVSFLGAAPVKKTGWALPTGISKRSTFDTAAVTLADLAGVVKALVEDLHATAGYGLLNA